MFMKHTSSFDPNPLVFMQLMIGVLFLVTNAYEI